MLVPSAALDLLSSEALVKIGEHIGNACGARVAARLGGEGGVRASDVETVISHLAGELAIAGIGAVHVERWGRALLVVVSNPSITDEAFVGAVLGAAMSAASGRAVAAAALGRDGNQGRYFLGSAATSQRVRALVGEGKGYAEIVASLQGGAS